MPDTVRGRSDDGLPLSLSRRLHREIASALPTALISVATSVAFILVFGTWDFLLPLISVAVLAHFLGAALRSLQDSLSARMFLPISLVAPVAIVYSSVGWLRFRDTLWFGLPLSDTWTSMWSDLRGSLTLIGDVVTPVDFDSGFGTIAMVAVAFIAVTTDAFAARYAGRVEVFVPAAATLFIIAAVGTEGSRVPIAAVWTSAAFVSAALIRRDHAMRAERAEGGRATNSPPGAALRSALGIGTFAAIVAVVASVVAPTLPGAREEAWLTQRSQGAPRELEPLVDIRRQLSESSPVELFTVRADAPAYWRMGALPDFDGSRWTISEKLLDSASGELTPPIGASDDSTDTIVNFQQFTIVNLAGNLVPVSATPTRLRASTQSLFYEPESGTLLVGSSGLSPRDSYEIQSTMVSPQPLRLMRATSAAPPSDAYLALPEDDAIDQLRDLANLVVPDGSSGYESALALQEFFRTGFTYSLDVPPLDGTDATLQFLDRKSGYCEHFASTFAVLARTLGLPSRVAIGFTPGDATTAPNGDSVYSVRSIHAHAWPEVWFDGLGWVLFEPTPGRGAPNSSYTNVPEEQAVEPPIPSTTIPETAPTTTVASSPATSIVANQPGEPGSVAHAAGGAIWPWIAIITLVALVLTWAIALPRLCRYFVRRRSETAILVLWRRAVALYELERGRIPQSMSPREVASAATSRLYDDDPFIFELAEMATRSLYDDATEDPASHPDFMDRSEAYLRNRRRRLPLPLRIRAVFDPSAAWRLAGGSSRSRP